MIRVAQPDCSRIPSVLRESKLELHISRLENGMAININRFYGREQWQLDCEIITPMFLGNANQEAELRAAPFKGLLRYWWRVANGWKYATHKELLTAESEIFGSPDDTGGKSQVTVAVKGNLNCYSVNGFPRGKTIKHPEVKNRANNPVNIDRFLYLGYGPIKRGAELKEEGKGAFYPGQYFTLLLSGSQQIMDTLRTTVQCIQQFGSIGSRSRNGWGCFSSCCNNISQSNGSELFHDIGTDWKDCFDHDYPHRLGWDVQKLLLWRCKNKFATWDSVLNDLAEIYLTVRLEHKFHGGGPHRAPQDRHTLGYPTGRNHYLKNFEIGRHASALRLMVRKESDGYRGYILHLPHLFSKEMWPNGKDRQIEIWKRVHTSLDKLCQRVELQEAQV